MVSNLQTTSLEYIMIWKYKECLHLVLMKDPFERIARGEKVIEYREKTDYWNRRL